MQIGRSAAVRPPGDPHDPDDETGHESSLRRGIPCPVQLRDSAERNSDSPQFEVELLGV